jgi:hypothetical protein
MMTPQQALNFLYSTLRGIELTAEKHEKIKFAATILIEVLIELDKFYLQKKVK